MDSSDLELVRRSRTGDMRAFDLLATRRRSEVFNYILRSTKDATAAEDLTQEVFFRAYRSLRRFPPKTSVRGWLLRIAVNLCIDEGRKSRRVPPMGSLESAEAFRLEDRRGGPELGTEILELHGKVREAIQGLEEDQRNALILREYHDLSYEQIARALDLNPGTVRSRLHRARFALKEKLEGYLREAAGKSAEIQTK